MMCYTVQKRILSGLKLWVQMIHEEEDNSMLNMTNGYTGNDGSIPYCKSILLHSQVSTVRLYSTVYYIFASHLSFSSYFEKKKFWSVDLTFWKLYKFMPRIFRVSSKKAILRISISTYCSMDFVVLPMGSGIDHLERAASLYHAVRRSPLPRKWHSGELIFWGFYLSAGAPCFQNCVWLSL
jgi:hypothetical protein